MRLDTRVSRATRIEVVTEGVLTRMLQADAALEGVAAVIFDEFHERSLQADLGLALTLDARANLSPGLRLLVMSATLDGAAVARLIGDAPLISAPGPQFPGDHALPARRPAAAAGRRARRGHARAARHAAHPARAARSRRRRARVPARRARDPARGGGARGRRRRAARRGAAALRGPRGRGAARRARARGPRDAQGRARHQHRRDQPHHRRA